MVYLHVVTLIQTCVFKRYIHAWPISSGCMLLAFASSPVLLSVFIETAVLVLNKWPNVDQNLVTSELSILTFEMEADRYTIAAAWSHGGERTRQIICSFAHPFQVGFGIFIPHFRWHRIFPIWLRLIKELAYGNCSLRFEVKIRNVEIKQHEYYFDNIHTYIFDNISFFCSYFSNFNNNDNR